jgi:flagellar basal-body rod protein FlgB
MTIIDNYLSTHQHALALRNQRLELISQNIANATTPNYRARDIDFAKAMATATYGGEMRATHRSHLATAANASGSEQANLVYRVPLSPSLDNNTVEMGVEQAAFGKAAADYQASLQFLENRISGLRKAFRGD